MPTLETYVAGVPVSGREVLSEALDSVFGANGVAIKDLSKENLRFSIRTANRKDTVVLVVLDSAAKDICEGIDNGLFSSNKFYEYSNDSKLVSFLNQHYGLELEMPEDVESTMFISDDTISSEEHAALVERYENLIADKESIIASLQAKVCELTSIIEEDEIVPPEPIIDTEEVDRLTAENVSLKSKVSDLESALGQEQKAGESNRVELESVQNQLAEAEKRYVSLSTDYSDLNQQLSSERVTSSKKSGVIRDKETEIERLKKSISSLEQYKEKYEGYSREKFSLELQLGNLRSEINSLKAKINSKDGEILRLQSDIEIQGKTTEQLESYKASLRDVEDEKALLQGSLEDKEAELVSAKEELSSVKESLGKAEEEIQQLSKRIEEDNKDITALNADKIELEGRITVLESASGRNADMEDLYKEYTDLKKEYIALSTSIFSRISDTALPSTSSKALLFTSVNLHLENVRFVFAGSTESRKGAYKCLLNEFRNKKENYLIVDAVSETSVDYVFKIGKLRSGMKWFSSGGGVLGYLSETKYNNIKVLSTGLNYVNDSFLLTVDWHSRLLELENSGYKVVVFCGDISNLVGRVMIETFTMVGDCVIYTHGNAVGSRSLVVNLKGLNNIKRVANVFFDYDIRVSKFYDMAASYCQGCSVANYVRQLTEES